MVRLMTFYLNMFFAWIFITPATSRWMANESCYSPVHNKAMLRESTWKIKAGKHMRDIFCLTYDLWILVMIMKTDTLMLWLLHYKWKRRQIHHYYLDKVLLSSLQCTQTWNTTEISRCFIMATKSKNVVLSSPYDLAWCQLLNHYVKKNMIHSWDEMNSFHRGEI